MVHEQWEASMKEKQSDDDSSEPGGGRAGPRVDPGDQGSTRTVEERMIEIFVTIAARGGTGRRIVVCYRRSW
jgi:hypothetical protein